MKRSIKEAAEKLKETKKCAIVCHENPDGDTLGAARALQLALGTAITDVFCADDAPKRYAFVGLHEIHRTFTDDGYDLLVYLDNSDEERVGGLLQTVPRGITTISIDHHGTNTDFADINIVNRSASSTCEVLYDLLLALDAGISPEIADSLYTGIVTDTGRFSFGYTTPKAHRVAADLIEKGARFEWICKQLFRTRSMGSTLLLKTMLDRLAFYEDSKIGFSYLLQEDFSTHGAAPQDAESLVNVIIEVEDVQIALLAREIENQRFKLSLRSKEGINVSKLALRFNGGGHAQASGCTMIGDVDTVHQRLLEAIDDLALIK